MRWLCYGLKLIVLWLGLSFLDQAAKAEPGYYYPGLGDIHTSVNPVKPGYYYSGWSKGWLPGPSPTERYYASGAHYQATHRHNEAAAYIQRNPQMSYHEKMSVQAELYPNLYNRYVNGPVRGSRGGRVRFR